MEVHSNAMTFPVVGHSRGVIVAICGARPWPSAVGGGHVNAQYLGMPTTWQRHPTKSATSLSMLGSVVGTFRKVFPDYAFFEEA